MKVSVKASPRINKQRLTRGANPRRGGGNEKADIWSLKGGIGTKRPASRRQILVPTNTIPRSISWNFLSNNLNVQ